jgi:hypothetical protein
MRQLCFAVACIALFACEDILPVENVDLCEGDHPTSADCDQCKRVPIPAGCPQCHTGSIDQDCENATPNGGSGNNGGTGGKSGSSATDGGKPSDAGKGGTGVGGSSGNSAAGDSGSGSSGTGGTGGMSGTGESGAGAGGSAGSPAPKCDSHDDCQNPTPQCNTRGVCVACSNSGACANRDATPHCDSQSGSSTRGQCVECTANSHCTAPAKPECGEGGVCVACTGNEGCKDPLKCNTEPTSAQLGQCVQCLSNTDCTDLANPECTEDNVCVPCTGNDACTNRPGTTKCNLDGLPDIKGHCVECTGASEDEICGTKSCKRSTGRCTNTTQGMRTGCQTCEADSECVSGAHCVTQDFDQTHVGTYCFFVDDDSRNCADVDAALRPFSTSTTLTSIDGMEAAYCMPVATCDAIADATAMGVNGGKTCSAITDDCGAVGLNDGICLSSQCSYNCSTDADCPSTGFTSCKGSGLSKFCVLP